MGPHALLAHLGGACKKLRPHLGRRWLPTANSWRGWPTTAVFSLQVVLRSDDHKGFVLLPKRWVVERTLRLRLNHHRRLNKDYERLPSTSETFIYIAMIRLMLRRLARV